MCKKWDKCTEAFQRSFLLVAQSAFLTTTFLDRAKPTAAWVGASHGGNYTEELGMSGASQVGREGFSGSQMFQAGLLGLQPHLWNINLTRWLCHCFSRSSETYVKDVEFLLLERVLIS